MIDELSDLQAIARQQQMLAEARQARLVAELRAPGNGQPAAQWSSSNLNSAVQQMPTGGAFDAAVRQLAQRLSRRRLWGVATAVALGTAIRRLPGSTDAKNRKRKRAKKLQLNSFGCVNVGKACRGNSDNCCSGICEGKTPQKGKKDRSRCVAHDVLECLAGQDACALGFVPCGTDPDSACHQTTGKASFCGGKGACAECRKDTDCEGEFGPKTSARRRSASVTSSSASPAPQTLTRPHASRGFCPAVTCSRTAAPAGCWSVWRAAASRRDRRPDAGWQPSAREHMRFVSPYQEGLPLDCATPPKPFDGHDELTEQ